MVDLKLELVVLPVTDVDRARHFYEKLGFRLDIDLAVSEDFRVVQLTPPGSEASVIFGRGVSAAEPGAVQCLYLIVSDIEKAHADLVDRGIDISDVFHDAGGVFHRPGTEGRVPGPHPERADYGSFASFSDPDGNRWVVQEVVNRAPGR
jgi:catechol 2,3-dioxygenase-like lactoylglutathione lyase family enzyme